MFRLNKCQLPSLTRQYVRQYASSPGKRSARFERRIQPNPTTMTVDDLQEFRNYVEEADLPIEQGERELEAPKFQYTGRNFSELLQTTWESLAGTTAVENTNEPAPSAVNANVVDGTSRPELKWIVCNKAKALMKQKDDWALYKLLRDHPTLLADVANSLSPLDRSLIIKRLTAMQMEIVKQFVAERSYASHLRDSTGKLRALRKTKEKVYGRVLKIVQRLGRGAPLTTWDYDTVLKFCLRNNQYRDAIQLIETAEYQIMNGDTSLQLTNAMWAAKIQILARALEETWTVDRYDLKRNRAQMLPVNYKYMNGAKPMDISSLTNGYRASGLPADPKVYKAMLLAYSKIHKPELLNLFIQQVWGVDSKGQLAEGFGMPERGTGLYPTWDLLSSIVLAYNYNSDLVTPLRICNGLIKNYKMDVHRGSNKFWETVLECVGLQGENVLRNMQKDLWVHRDEQPLDVADQDRNATLKDIDVRHEAFDSTWNAVIAVVGKPSKRMIKQRMRYASLDSLIGDISKVYDLVHNPRSNVTTSEAAYNENLLLSYLNHCVKALIESEEFYKADDLITKNSLDRATEAYLQKKLAKAQQKHLKQLARERLLQKEQKQAEDDEGLLGLF